MASLHSPQTGIRISTDRICNILTLQRVKISQSAKDYAAVARKAGDQVALYIQLIKKASALPPTRSQSVQNGSSTGMYAVCVAIATSLIPLNANKSPIQQLIPGTYIELGRNARTHLSYCSEEWFC